MPFVRADEFQFGFCSYLHHRYFNWAAVPGRRFSNSPTSQSPNVVRQASETLHKYDQINLMKIELKENGFVHLTNQSEEQLLEILNSLGVIIMTTDIIIKKESKGLVTTALGIDFHTDHHNAKFIAWYCYKQTDLGGDSLLIDAEKLFLQLPIEQQESLKTVELFEHKIFPDDKKSYPFVEIDENNSRQFHCSLVNDLDKENSAFISFQKLVSETQPIKINLKKQDILIIDNHRMFHSRTPIKGSKDRHLKRYWLKK
jgi:Taurine catabolism dioxygenase TauD, TfdA family